jgi:ATP-binding cassette subfamily B protein
MKKNTLFWLFSHYRRRIPTILLMMAAQVGNSLLSVFFALGTRGVIDGAISGDRNIFLRACLYQAAIILGIQNCVTLMRHLRERLRADLDWDWKRRLLHGLLHGDYAAVSSYHSAELINRLNNDVNKLDEGILTLLPTAVSMITRVVAAVVVLGVLDARFTVVIALLGGLALLATGVMRRRLKELNKRVSHHDGVVSWCGADRFYVSANPISEKGRVSQCRRRVIFLLQAVSSNSFYRR